MCSFYSILSLKPCTINETVNDKGTTRHYLFSRSWELSLKTSLLEVYKFEWEGVILLLVGYFQFSLLLLLC